VSHNIGTGGEVEIRLKPDGSLNIKSPTSVNVECKTAVVNAETTTWNGDVTLNGNLTQEGIYTLDGVNMNTHVHGGVQPGPSVTSVPQ
jgi:phage baseplate assembly protein gpV